MKNCPYCNEKVGYGNLIKHSFGGDKEKFDTCGGCGNTYKITLNFIFLILIAGVAIGTVLFLMPEESRGMRKIAGAAILFLLLPTLPVFMKLSKTN